MGAGAFGHPARAPTFPGRPLLCACEDPVLQLCTRYFANTHGVIADNMIRDLRDLKLIRKMNRRHYAPQAGCSAAEPHPPFSSTFSAAAPNGPKRANPFGLPCGYGSAAASRSSASKEEAGSHRTEARGRTAGRGTSKRPAPAAVSTRTGGYCRLQRENAGRPAVTPADTRGTGLQQLRRLPGTPSPNHH